MTRSSEAHHTVTKGAGGSGAIEVVVYNPKGKIVYAQYISPKLIRLSKLVDKLEDFFIALSMGED